MDERYSERDKKTRRKNKKRSSTAEQQWHELKVPRSMEPRGEYAPSGARNYASNPSEGEELESRRDSALQSKTRSASPSASNGVQEWHGVNMQSSTEARGDYSRSELEERNGSMEEQDKPEAFEIDDVC